VVKIYGTRSCGICDSARRICRQYGEHYESFDISIRKYYLEAIASEADITKIPLIFVNDKYIGDYTNLLNYLREKRYDY